MMQEKRRVEELLNRLRLKNKDLYTLAKDHVSLLVKTKADKEAWLAFIKDLEVAVLID